MVTRTRSSNDKASAIIVERRADGGKWWWAARLGPTEAVWTDSTLRPGVNFDYRMKVVGANEIRSAAKRCGESAALPPFSVPRLVASCWATFTSDGSSAALTKTRSHKDEAAAIIIERRVDGGSWSGATRVPATQAIWTDTSLLPDAEVDYRMTVVGKNEDLSKPRRCGETKSASKEPPAGPTNEWYQTANVDGRWEIVRSSDRTQPALWKAVSLRGDAFWNGSYSVDDQTVADLATRFDVVRMPLHWDDVEPTGPQTQAQLNADPRMRQVADLIRRLGDAGVGVVLDPMHAGANETRRYWLPQWAWDEAKSARDLQHAYDNDDMFEVVSYRTETGATLGGDYLQRMLIWSQQFENIIAFELMNEPHPPNHNPYESTDEIISLFNEWIPNLRAIDNDKPLILSGFFGAQLSKSTAVRAGLVTEDGTSKYPNLIWSAHSYHTGLPAKADSSTRGGDEIDFDADDDGFGDPDLSGRDEWRRGTATGTSAANWRTGGCYAVSDKIVPDPTRLFSWEEVAARSAEPDCGTSDPAVRAIARANMAEGFAEQDRVAQAGNMPLFIGEYGHSRVFFNAHPQVKGWVGWGNAKDLACDRLWAINSVGRHGAASAWWHFDSRVGTGFGLYNPRTHTWYDDPADRNNGDQGTARPFQRSGRDC